MIPNDATLAQIRAANPRISTWLAANAGSGKTRVLTDRVARLLLADTPPEKILCLTYTKAAATEMQNRLFDRLGAWAMQTDGTLENTLKDLGYDGPVGPQILAKSRALFAQAIETPGGLKIQTIHAFCAAVLRRFPLEAGVSPQFQEMDDRTARLLRSTILQDLADGPDQDALMGLAEHLSGDTFDEVSAAIAGARHRFDPLPEPQDLAVAFDVPVSAPEGWIYQDVIQPGDRDFIDHLSSVLRGQSKTMVDLADALDALGPDAHDHDIAQFVASKFLTKDGAPHKRVPTVKTWEALGAEADRLTALVERLAEAHDRPKRLHAFEATCALHRFAKTFLPRYERGKAARGWLDFDDLILKTKALLSNPNVADWVLWRLDGGIDHVLVDEAQDTSPEQWDVVERLAEDFTSGRSARTDTERTIFVVGDKKQSIYSFQGADPTGFDRMRERFREKLSDIGASLQDAALEYSFRSSRSVLDLVDRCFDGKERSGFPDGLRHRAFHDQMPGRVDLWPALPKSVVADERNWTDTVDHVDDTHHSVRLAEHVAAQIKAMLAGSDNLPVRQSDGTWAARAIQPKDILILVQRRSTIFAEINRACKAAGLPIAGADRLKIGAEMAVGDLTALLAWLALPEDNLALATVLRSPLFGWSEAQLFSLAHARAQTFLWRALEAQKESHAETWAVLRDLRDSADFLRPFELLERILIHHDGRKRLLARLGSEAEDGIDALLDQALSYESTDVPSLTGFLIWMDADEFEIKRQPDSASNQIRVMTVHGSKGLEAPIVILPDCAVRRTQIKDPILATPHGPVWKVKTEDQPRLMRPWIDAEKDRQAQERDRLLYVAMTRAENWLIVGAAGDLGTDGDAWHDSVREGMERQGALARSFGELGEGLRLSAGEWPAPESHYQQTTEPQADPLPDWAHRRAPDPPQPLPVLSPSKLGGAKALPGEDGQDPDAAMAYGEAVHIWLERLANQPSVQPTGSAPDTAYREALALRRDPKLGFLFAPGTLGEVSVSAWVPLVQQRMRGTIDRLIIEPHRIVAVDFKTNATPPASPQEIPEGLLRQMGAYAHMLGALYPGRDIVTALLWTTSGDLMEIPHDLVTDALLRTRSP